MGAGCIIEGQRVVDFVSERTRQLHPHPHSALGYERDGKLIAGLVFTVFTGPDINISVAADGELPRILLRAAGYYVFEQLGCVRATFRTEQRSVVEMAERLGGEVEAHCRNLFGRGRDGVLVGILKDDWKFNAMPAPDLTQ